MSQNIYTEAWKKILRDASQKIDAQGSLKVSYPAAQITSLGDRGAYAGRFNAQHGKCTYYKDSAPFRDLKIAFETGAEFRSAFPGYLEIILNAQDEITITHQRENNLAAKEETTISAPEPLQKTQSMNHPLNLILYGPPGTGKTYHTVNKALETVDPAFYEANKDNRKQLTSRFKELLINDWTNPAGKIAFVTFHQSSSYEDFIEGIKPVVIEASDNEPGYITYEVKDGLFKLIAEKASWRSGNFDRVFTEFKESINELKEKKPLTITSKYTTFDVIFRETTVLYVKPLSSKKENAWYPVSIVNLRKVYETGDYEGVYNLTYVREILQYLKDKKGLTRPTDTNSAAPEPHVLIIDEINRGNIAQIFGELITLLEPNKRAGAEEELHVVLPYSKKPFSVPDNLYVIGTMNTADRSVEALDTALRRRFSFKEMMPQDDLDEIRTTNIAGTDIDFKDVLRTINKRLEKLVGRDHKIGHSYFMSEQEEKWEFYLKAFRDKIIPLLQEYFYGDYAKMCLVIGKGFVDVNASLSDESDAKFFAVADHDALDDFKAKKVWEIKSIATEQEFATALVTLLNK